MFTLAVLANPIAVHTVYFPWYLCIGSQLASYYVDNVRSYVTMTSYNNNSEQAGATYTHM